MQRSHRRRHWASSFSAELECQTSHDQCAEDDKQRQVVGAECGGIPERECGEHRPRSEHQPRFVGIPDRADRIDHDPSVGVVFTEDRSSTPTPKSNPSSTKYDANMNPISTNQNSGNVTAWS
jgi:hypothetical protein